MTKERWLPVVGFSDYKVSDLGRIRRLVGRGIDGRPVRGHLLKGISKRPYVWLSRGGKKYRRRISIVVLTTFVGPRPSPKHEGRHLNDVPTENNLANLAWGTRLENRADAIRNGRMARGVMNGIARLTEEQVTEFRRDYYYHGEKNMRYFSRKFGVKHQTLWRVLHSETWGHVR